MAARDLFREYIKRYGDQSLHTFIVQRRWIQHGEESSHELHCKIYEIVYQKILEDAEVTELSFWLFGPI
jgi:hypothetical protein